MKQFIHKKRRSGGLKRYRAPMGYTRTSMQWGKWETVSKYGTLLEACDSLKGEKDIKNIVGSTENKVFFSGRLVFWLDSDWWLKTSNRLGSPDFRDQLNRLGEAIQQGSSEIFEWDWSL